MILLYVTFETADEAETIIKGLLEQHLIACGNVMAPITSYFYWEGKVQNNQEIAAILKTTEGQYEAVHAYITERHSYDVPCILKLPVQGGHQPFLDWVAEECS